MKTSFRLIFLTSLVFIAIIVTLMWEIFAADVSVYLRVLNVIAFSVGIVLALFTTLHIRSIQYSKDSLLIERDKDADILANEERVQALIKESNAFVWETDKKGNYTFVSPEAEAVIGYKPDELVNKKSVWDIMPEDTQQAEIDFGLRAIEEGIRIQGYDNRIVHKEGKTIWVSSSGMPLKNDTGKTIGFRGIDIHITDRKEAELKLQASENTLSALFDYMEEGLVMVEAICDENDQMISYRVKRINHHYETILSLKEAEVINQDVRDVFGVKEAPYLAHFNDVYKTGKGKRFEAYFEPTSQHLLMSLYKIDDKLLGTLFMDISKEKERETHIEYLSTHDSLTGLKNRYYYDQIAQTYETQHASHYGVIMADLNGLKLINDAFGHELGDALMVHTAEYLKSFLRAEDDIMRLGGDEFIIIMPHTHEEDVKTIHYRMVEQQFHHPFDGLPFSLSIGYAMGREHRSFYETTRIAEAFLYQHKLKESENYKRTVIDRIMETFRREQPVEYKHMKRVSALCERFALELNMSEQEVNQVKEVAYYHDIGKIAVNQAILDKVDPLTDIEFLEIQRHSELTYHILSSVNLYAQYADQALSHHENVDGTGYPRGIKADKIPFISKMIRIADSYEAMTRTRTYAKAKTHQEAVQELRDFKGIYYDEDLVETFVEKVL